MGGAKIGGSGMSVTTLRPSTLPKLVACPKYVNSPYEAGPAAKRGTLMDEAYRFTLMGEMVRQCNCGFYFNREDGCDCLAGEDEIDSAIPLEVLDQRILALAERENCSLEPGREAVEWAIKKTKFIADGHDIITEEKFLWVDIEEMDSGGGTMDGDVPELSIGIDLKSGRIRNYKEQMASYALGRMRAAFLERYTMILIFADERETVTHTFTYEEAEYIVTRLRNKHIDPDEEATPCEYCSWCGAFESCQARKELATRVSGHMNIQERWEIIMEDPEELAEFVTGASMLDDFVKQAKKKLLEFSDNGIDIPGFHKRKGKITRTLPADNLIEWLSNNTSTSINDVVRVFGGLSEAKFKKLAESAGTTTEGVNLIERQGASYVQKSPLKKKT